jgi:hypothetical protein
MFSLCDLPDELLLQVVRFLEAIRSYETQSAAFKDKDKEKARQRENNIRQRSLHALCLTSQRLRRLSLPFLYSSSITCATASGLKSLQLLQRTLTSPIHALGQSKRLSEHLRYLENRTADYKGNSLQDDEVFRSQQGPVATYFQLLAGLVLLAPNLNHICVVSLEHDDTSLWTHLLETTQCIHLRNGTSKLRHLLVQIHANGWDTSTDFSVSERLIQQLPAFTMLQDLRISGAITQRAGTLPLLPSKSLDLRRLDLTENALDIDDAADLLLACKNIRHFTCKWTLYNDVYVNPSVLRKALLAHANTLEILSLDWREVRFLLSNDANVRLLGSLRFLMVLKTLEISDLGFLSSDRSLLDFPGEVLDNPLSALLPQSLQQMTLLTEAIESPLYDDVLDDAICLWYLARDCKASLPDFKTLSIRAACDMSVLTLALAFEQAGVQLYVQREA